MPHSTGVTPKRHRRAADLTALRLGRAVLAYLVAITVMITLAPFRFAGQPTHGFTAVWTWSDLVMNIVMFVPLGFVYQLTRPAGSPVQWIRVLALGLALSGGIEVVQLFESTRFSSVFDLATNTAGAVLGAWCYAVALRRIEGRSTVKTLALELPLMGLVYLLVPLMWLIGLASDGGSRVWLVLPVTAVAGGVLGTVYAAYIEPSRNVSRIWLVVAALSWVAISLLPGAIRERDLILASIAMVLSTAWLRSLSTGRYREQYGTRRFEIPTLRLLMPLFAAYLALSSLWPLDAADLAWRGMFALLPADDASMNGIFVALEHVAAFTLVGYIVAEFYGRDLRQYREIVWQVLRWGGGLSLLLEVVRGFHPHYRASLSMAAYTLGAAFVGGWLYHLQREHVRALLVRREVWARTGATAEYPAVAPSSVTWSDPAAPAPSAP